MHIMSWLGIFRIIIVIDIFVIPDRDESTANPDHSVSDNNYLQSVGIRVMSTVPCNGENYIAGKSWCRNEPWTESFRNCNIDSAFVANPKHQGNHTQHYIMEMLQSWYQLWLYIYKYGGDTLTIHCDISDIKCHNFYQFCPNEYLTHHYIALSRLISW